MAPDLGHLGALDARRALLAPAGLQVFNDLAVLTSADIHVATRLAALVGENRPDAVLGAAFAVRAVRLGHVCVDLSTIAATASSDLDPAVDLARLPWPSPRAWMANLDDSPLVAGDGAEPDRGAWPLHLVGSRLYLDRYWRQERQVAADLIERIGRPIAGVDETALDIGLARLFPRPDRPGVDLARLAATLAVTGRLTVLAGGPGTGKTTTVARLLALIDEQATATGGAPPRCALAAPTGKAAARLAEAVHDEAGQLDVSDAVRSRLIQLEASTLHRLLGWRPDSHSRFRHDRTNRLPHDVVVIDETSMLSLSLMAKLVDAVRPDARLILVGDPQQLASVEAGAVLGDVVGPAAMGMRMAPATRRRLGRLAGVAVPATDPPAGSVIGDGIVVLQRVYRFGGGIAELANAVASGDGDRAVDLLNQGRTELRWAETDDVRVGATRTGTTLVEAAARSHPREALAALGALRVLCAHRQGPAGVGAWNERIERWLAAAIPGYAGRGAWYPGRPLLVTENDHELRLYNGDTGVIVVGADGRPTAVFERQGGLREVAPTRLRAVETVRAMTIHKSQGSQFDEVVVVLPDSDGPILTRELLYTAITRARRRVTVIGPEAVLRAAVKRPITRASGLGERLWNM